MPVRRTNVAKVLATVQWSIAPSLVDRRLRVATLSLRPENLTVLSHRVSARLGVERTGILSVALSLPHIDLQVNR